jgi:uncharacterized membrane protein
MTPTTPAAQSPVRTAFRWLLGLTLLSAGTSHLTIARSTFQAQVPRWLPLNPDLVVILSGIVEMVLGSSLIVAKRRRPTVGWIVAAFFVAIFPGNYNQYVNRIDAFGLDSDTMRLARLFLHPVLPLWALWSTGAWPKSRA